MGSYIEKIVHRIYTRYNISSQEALLMVDEEWEMVEEGYIGKIDAKDIADSLVSIYMAA